MHITKKAIKIMLSCTLFVLFGAIFSITAKAAQNDYYFDVDTTTQTITGIHLPSTTPVNIEVYISSTVPTSINSSTTQPISHIGYKAFENNPDAQNITKLTIDGIQGIGALAFENLQNLEELTIIGDSDMYIDYGAFMGCDKLKKITFDIPNFHVPIYNVDRALYAPIDTTPNAPQLPTPINKENNAIFAYTNQNGSNSSSFDVIFGPSVEKVPDYMFAGICDCNRVKSITLDNTATIGRYAFDGCTELKDITWGNTLTTIEHYAFRGCTNLTTLSLPSTTEFIQDSAFENCTGLISLTIPANTKTIYAGAFANCTNLSKINFNAKNLSDLGPDNTVFSNAGEKSGSVDVSFGSEVKKIPEYLFNTSVHSEYSANKISKVNMSNSITTVGTGAFKDCINLKYIKYSTKLNTICKSAFEKCLSLTIITLPEGLESVQEYAFDSCTAVHDITLPQTLKYAGHNAFGNCTALDKLKFNCIELSDFGNGNNIFSKAGEKNYTLQVTFGNKVKKIPNYLFDSFPGLKKVTISNSVTAIGKEAFKDCIHLTYVKFGDKVKTIESGAFNGCIALNQTKIPEESNNLPKNKLNKLPKSLKTIENHAFANCLKLKHIKIQKETNYIGPFVFDNCSGFKIYCYKKSPAETYAKSNKITYAYYTPTPTNVKVNKTSYTSTKVSWKKVSDAKKYYVYRSTSKNKNYKKILTINKNSITRFKDINLTPNKTYYYVIKAIAPKKNKVDVDSEYSPAKSANLKVKTVKLYSAIQSSKNTNVTVKWKRIGDVAGYQLQVKKTGEDWEPLKNFNNKMTRIFTHTKRGVKVKYQYRVRAFIRFKSKKYYGPYSNVKSVTIKEIKKKTAKKNDNNVTNDNNNTTT